MSDSIGMFYTSWEDADSSMSAVVTKFEVGSTYVYKSSLAWSSGTKYVQCIALYSPFDNGEFQGGVIESTTALLTEVGIVSFTAPDTVGTGETATFTAKVDFPPSSTGELFQRGGDTSFVTESTTIYPAMKKYVLTKDVSSTDSGWYQFQATYDVGTTGTFSTYINVVDNCEALTAPNNGALDCTTSYTTLADATCSLECDSGYKAYRGVTEYTCTDGVWSQNSVKNPSNKVNKCSRVTYPSAYYLTVQIGYTLPWTASCTDYFGDYIRLAFYFFLKTADTSLTCVTSGDCELMETWFEYDSLSNRCSTNGKVLWQTARYKQSSGTETKQTTELYGELITYLSGASFSPFTVLDDNGCYDSDDDCFKTSSDCLLSPDTIDFSALCSSSSRKRRSALDGGSSDGSVDLSVGDVMILTDEGDVTCDSGYVPSEDKCMMCSPGSYQYGDECVSCQQGSYQALSGQTSCSSCPSGTSTLTEGSTSADSCESVCVVETVTHGVSVPPANWLVREGSLVTVICNEGYSINGKAVGIIKMNQCEEEFSCSRVELTTDALNVFSGSDIQLTCTVTRTTAPTSCTWTRDDVTIATTSHVSMVREGEYECMTTVSSVVDSALYTCSDGEDTSSSIHIRALGISFDSTDVTVPEGKEHTYVCAVTVPPTSTAIISWTRNEQEVGERLESTSNPTIATHTVSSAGPLDSGEYRCSVTYLDIGTSTSQPSTLTVLAFLRRLTDLSVSVGDDVTLECTATEGSPIWRKDGVTLSGVTTTALSLRSVTPTDGGVYQCSVTLNGETITSTSTVYVLSESFYPFITDEVVSSPVEHYRHPDTTTIQLGQSATFTCASGDTITWRKDGVTIAAGVTGDGDTSTLTLSDVTESCMVQCIVDGVISKPAILNIIGISVDPKPRIITSESTTTLACTAVGSGLVEVQWLRDNNLWVDGGVSVTSAGYRTVSVLESGVAGSYRCLAKYNDGVEISSTPAKLTLADVALEGAVVQPGSSLTLSCVITGAIPTFVYWTLDGAKVRTQELFTITSTTSATATLTIDSIDEEGRYLCTAGQASHLSVIQSPVAEVNLIGFLELPRDMILEQGDSGEMEFTARLDSDSEVVCNNGVTTVNEEGGVSRVTLEFTGVMVTITVTCQIKRNNDVIATSEALLFIVDSPQITVPVPSIVYGDVLVATLTTTYLSSSPSIHWTVNGVRTSTSSSTTTGKVLTSQLRWPATVDLEVSATIHHYDLGRVTMATKHVTVYGVERVVGPDVAVVGGTYNLTCVVDTDLQVRAIVWTLDGDRVGGESVQEITQPDNKIHSVLNLPYLSVNDYGVYVCGAEFGDGSVSSYSHHLVQSTDCAVPEIPNALYLEGVPVLIEHTGTLEVICGEDTIIMQCQLGSWDTQIVACPDLAISEALMLQLITGVCVLVVCVVVALSVLLVYKKNKRERAVSPEARPDSVSDFKMRLQRDGFISNPVLQSTTNEDLNDEETMERELTAISTH